MRAKHSVLVLFAHPAVEKSRLNRAMAEAIRDVEGVSFHDLYETYPDLDVDVAREQQLLRVHDVVVMQHPLYWYSTPALLKQWQDLVLEYGWAYGEQGTVLRGKTMLNAVTTAGNAAAYTQSGSHGHTLLEFLAPLRQTAKLCGMTYLPPFVAHDAWQDKPARLKALGAEYRTALIALRDGTLPLERAQTVETLNALVHLQPSPDVH